MAVRQYIGARYVLKIYENSADPLSAEWESGVSYEPLVMVNYNYSSYISRKQVPATVGNPVDNPSYWALSGLYNGQIANIQNEIGSLGDLTTPDNSSIVNAINSVTKRQLVILGDSFSVAGYVTPGQEWYNLLKDNTDFDIYNFAVGGAGFATHQAGSIYISEEIPTAVAGVPDVNQIDFVIVYGGVNDYNLNASESDIYNACYSTLSAVVTAFPKAKIIYVPFNFGNATTLTMKHMRFLQAMCEAGDNTAGNILTYKFAPAMFLDRAKGQYLTSGHPNAAGNKRIYEVMNQLLNGDASPIRTLRHYSPVVWNGVQFVNFIRSEFILEGFEYHSKIIINVPAGTYTGTYRIAELVDYSGTASNDTKMTIDDAYNYFTFANWGTDLITRGAKFKINSDGSIAATFASETTFAGATNSTYVIRGNVVAADNTD